MDAFKLWRQLRSALRAGRRGVTLERLNIDINRDRTVPVSSLEELATAARDAGVSADELNLANPVAMTNTFDGTTVKDRDPIRDAVAAVYEVEEVTA